MAEFRIAMNVSLDGIGALLQNEDGVTSIKKLIPGGAAIEVVINKEYGAIKSGDTIIQVGEDDPDPEARPAGNPAGEFR